ncbi:MAG: LysR family transcriptional regulator [Deltaproteobacteria bacterium]|nr:LysR family transcriptional regulator [Deltaproteobacteria bacterium]
MGEAPKIDLRSLRYVLAVATSGSFARAAEELGITQPALSRSVRVLEQALGVRLFDRGRFGTFTTAFGRMLIERGRTLLADADAIEREIQSLDSADVGTLTIGAAAYPAELSVGEAAGRLIARHPGLELRITVADWPELIRRVLAEEVDLAICDYEAAESDERLVIEALPVHEAFLFCRSGHPLEHVTAIDLATARQYPLVLNSLPPRSANLARRHPHDAKTMTPEIHVDTFDLARRIVLGSDALGVAAWPQIAAEVQARRIAIVPIPGPWLSSRYGFVRRARRSLSPSARAFMVIVRDVERELSDAPRGDIDNSRLTSRDPPETRPRRGARASGR